MYNFIITINRRNVSKNTSCLQSTLCLGYHFSFLETGKQTGSLHIFVNDVSVIRTISLSLNLFFAIRCLQSTTAVKELELLDHASAAHISLAWWQQNEIHAAVVVS